MSLLLGKVQGKNILHISEGKRDFNEMAVITTQPHTNFISTGTYYTLRSTVRSTSKFYPRYVDNRGNYTSGGIVGFAIPALVAAAYVDSSAIVIGVMRNSLNGISYTLTGAEEFLGAAAVQRYRDSFSPLTPMYETAKANSANPVLTYYIYRPTTFSNGEIILKNGILKIGTTDFSKIQFLTLTQVNVVDDRFNLVQTGSHSPDWAGMVNPFFFQNINSYAMANSTMGKRTNMESGNVYIKFDNGVETSMFPTDKKVISGVKSKRSFSFSNPSALSRNISVSTDFLLYVKSFNVYTEPAHFSFLEMSQKGNVAGTHFFKYGVPSKLFIHYYILVTNENGTLVRFSYLSYDGATTINVQSTDGSGSFIQGIYADSFNLSLDIISLE